MCPRPRLSPAQTGLSLPRPRPRSPSPLLSRRRCPAASTPPHRPRLRPDAPTPLPLPLSAPSSSSPPRCPDASTPPCRPRPRPPPPVTAAPPPLSSQILLGSLLPVPLSHAFFFFNPNPNLNPLYSGAPHLSHPIGDLLTIPPPALRRTKELLVWEQAGYVSPLPIRVLLQLVSTTDANVR